MSTLRTSISSVPVLRGVLDAVPAYSTGSVIENRLGLQVLRTTGKHVAWRLRSKQAVGVPQEYLRTLERDGLLVLPDFLSTTEFEQVRREFDSTPELKEFRPYLSVAEGRLYSSRYHLPESGSDHPAIRSRLQCNPLILSLASAAVRRPIGSMPPVLMNVYRMQNPGGIDQDRANLLHADLHAPTVKTFYFPSGADEENGAYIYATGSHRVSMARLAHEYEMSVRKAVQRNNGNVPEDWYELRPPRKFLTVSEGSLRRMRIEETLVAVKANTLVISNNMGFHRRGVASTDKPRESIVMSFRYLEPPTGTKHLRSVLARTGWNGQS